MIERLDEAWTEEPRWLRSLSRIAERLPRWLQPSDIPGAPPERTKLIHWASLCVLASAVMWFPLAAVLPPPPPSYAASGVFATGGALVARWLLHRKRLDSAAAALTLGAFLASAVISLIQGPTSPGNGTWVTGLILGTAVFGPKAVLPISVAATGTIAASIGLVKTGVLVSPAPPPQSVIWLGWLSQMVMNGIFMAALSQRYLSALARAKTALKDRIRADSLEQRLRDQQRMEALGRLAAGVAHEFNNALTVVLGGVDLAREQMGAGASAEPTLDTIAMAARNATNISAQLSAFGRRPSGKPEAVDVSTRLTTIAESLKRILPESVQVSVEAEADGAEILEVPGELDQILVNLALNANYAMPTGGTLVLSSARSGDHVTIALRDSGTGMDEATRKRVFEPFFTTKPVGEGTGLGLALIHGIVTTRGGNIEVESAPGAGSTFSIHLPLATGSGEADETGQERVLA